MSRSQTLLRLSALALALSAAWAAPQFPTSLDGLEHTQNRFAADAGYSLDTTTREPVRLFFNTVYAASDGVASGWRGDLASCHAGDTSAEFKAAMQRRINWFRAMAGLPAAVELDNTFNQKAQQAALMMAANRSLSHNPPTSWKCYSAAGAEGAGKSNIYLGSFGPGAISGYILDPGGGNSAVGHRRWVLYPQTRFMGVGDVDGAVSGMSSNALWVQDGNAWSVRPAVRDDFVAWPPKGYVPYQTVYPRWSLSYPKADFSAARVSMTENGQPMATQLEPLANGYGENTLVWLPGNYRDGSRWQKPAADTVYRVTVDNVLVNGAAKRFEYSVIVFDPAVVGADSVAATVDGPANAPLNQGTRYRFGNVPGATSYQWRVLSVEPYSLEDGAEQGSSRFDVSISAGYEAVVSSPVASGAAAFHLAHTQASNQTLTLKQSLVPSASTTLRFDSRLGLSTAGEVALVEVSGDDGKSWSEVYRQAGGSNEKSFQSRSVALAAYAGQTIKLRFRYAHESGSYYPQANSGIGWYLDNISLSGADRVADSGTPTEAGSDGFEFRPTASGVRLLQARPGMYGHFSTWGPLKRVTVDGTVLAEEERLFNWAEFKFRDLFHPAAVSLSLLGYTARAYANGVYLGVKDGQVYVYGPQFNGLLGVGRVADYMSQVTADGY
ncbi:CAP domain-containing protein [Chitinimonas lacunae]|uniref:CAP domain-containing protein n=1 Tax=Chitinimonas lacunae TaxID=1963018 RepID=A0ABV8MVZ4_9NEIS